MSDIKLFLWRNKEGIIIGAITGFIIGKWILPMIGFDYSVMVQDYSVIDTLKSTGLSTLEWAKTKAIYLTTIFGAIIGTIIDEFTPEKRWFK
jgi:hypothetical protein